jgi:hypothetical protein
LGVVTTPVGQLIPVTLIYDQAAGSPPNRPDLQALNGQKYLMEPIYIPLPPQGVFVGQPGYSRQQGGAWQWVLTGDDAGTQLDLFVDGLTNQPYGWADQPSRTTWKQAVQRLRQEGLPRSLIQTMVSGMFTAARTEVTAEQARPQGP